MSTLKQRIRLQQAEEARNRGLITQVQFDAIKSECDYVEGQSAEMAGEPGQGDQLGESGLPPVNSKAKAKQKSTPKGRKSSAAATTKTNDAGQHPAGHGGEPHGDTTAEPTQEGNV